MATQDLRKSPRFQIEAPVQLWIGDIGGSQRSIRTSAVNISRNGLYLRGEYSPPLDAEVRFEAILPAPIGGNAGCVLRGNCRAVRRDELGSSRLGWAAVIDTFQIRPLVE